MSCSDLCNIIDSTLGIIMAIIAFIIYLPFMPFVCIASAIYPSKADPEERDGLISRDKARKENEERMNKIINRAMLRL